MRQFIFAVLVIALGSLAGCSGSGGPAGTTADRASTAARATSGDAKLAQAQRTHEYPGPPQHQTATGGATSPTLAIEAFATAYINWNAGTVSKTMRALTQLSVGQARSVVSMAAAQTARDYELKRGGIANAGIVEAIAPVVGRSNEYAVVTQERTTATNTNAYQGLRPAWHVALATVTRSDGGRWVLSSWQPEN